MKVVGKLRTYRIVGRALPSTKDPNPQLYRMRLFAADEVVAKSKYWYYLKKLKKVKKTRGEIVEVKLITEPNKFKRVKNYGIWLRYNSRSGIHNMYREYRDVSTEGAVTKCYRDMAGRHRARSECIQVIKVEEIPSSKCTKPDMKQFHNSSIKFPAPFRYARNFNKPRFTSKRPNFRYI